MSLCCRQSCLQMGTFGKTSHAATRWRQEPSLCHCTAGYSLGWEQRLDTSPVTVLELSPEDTRSQQLPQRGTAGDTGMRQERVGTGKLFDQVEIKSLQTPPSFLSSSNPRNAAEGGFASHDDQNTPTHSIIPFPCTHFPLFTSLSFHSSQAGRDPGAAPLGPSKWVRLGTGPPGTAQLVRAD